MAITSYGPKPVAEEIRFWSKVDRRGPDDCWAWKAGLAAGYGSFRVGSLTDGSRRKVGSHVWVCTQAHGLGPGQWALHTCDNKPCCNPAHIYAGTHADNTRDAVDRGLCGGPPMPGTKNPNAKLSAEQVREICASSLRNVDLAKLYGVSKTHIGHLRSGKSWRTLDADLDVRRP